MRWCCTLTLRALMTCSEQCFPMQETFSCKWHNNCPLQSLTLFYMSNNSPNGKWNNHYELKAKNHHHCLSAINPSNCLPVTAGELLAIHFPVEQTQRHVSCGFSPHHIHAPKLHATFFFNLPIHGHHLWMAHCHLSLDELVLGLILFHCSIPLIVSGETLNSADCWELLRGWIHAYT